MRILMVAQFYPPVAGGEEQHVRNLSTALVERGHDVSVASVQLEDDDPLTLDRKVRVHRLRTTVQRAKWLYSSSRPFAPPVPDPEAVISLRRLIDVEQPDLIHAHNWLGRSVMPRLARGRRPLVVTLHDYGLICANKRFIYRQAPCSGPGLHKCIACATDHYGAITGTPITIANWAGGAAERRAVDMFLPVSHAVAEGTELERRGVPFRVIPNFVPDDVGQMTDVDDPALANLPDRDYLLFVGDLTHDKGVDVLLDAFGKLEDPPSLVLIGRPFLPLRTLPRVIELGMLPHAVVMTAWRRSLLGVVPSIYPDPCPTVVMEAMATGRALVASHIGGIPDLIDDGETGILVPHSDSAALAHGLQRLLDSPELCRRMGNAARHKLTEFTTSRVVPRIEQVYRDVLDGYHTRGPVRLQPSSREQES